MNLNELKDVASKQQKIIADYLLELAKNDECLMNKLLETDKTMQGCMSYITDEAKKQAENNVAMIQDSDVYEWAKHYFLEDSLSCEPKGNKEIQAEIEEYNTSSEEDPVEEKPVKQKETKADKIKDKLYDGLDLFSME